ESNERGRKNHAGIGPEIERANLIEETCHQMSGRQSDRETEAKSDIDQDGSATEDHPGDIAPGSTHCRPHANLASTEIHGLQKHAVKPSDRHGNGKPGERA